MLPSTSTCPFWHHNCHISSHCVDTRPGLRPSTPNIPDCGKYLLSIQVESLNKRGIPACSFHSTLPAEIRSKAASLFTTFLPNTEPLPTTTPTPISPSAPPTSLRLIYTTPETLSTNSFRSLITALHKRDAISLVAVDEAHCISEWGHDFRKSFRKIGTLREVLDGVPFIALTATATVEVRRDIMKQLNMAVSNSLFISHSLWPPIFFQFIYFSLSL